MDAPTESAENKSEKRGLECSRCGCQHFRVLYTRRAWAGAYFAVANADTADGGLRRTSSLLDRSFCPRALLSRFRCKQVP